LSTFLFYSTEPLFVDIMKNLKHVYSVHKLFEWRQIATKHYKIKMKIVSAAKEITGRVGCMLSRDVAWHFLNVGFNFFLDQRDILQETIDLLLHGTKLMRA